jgi:hypothetical protein
MGQVVHAAGRKDIPDLDMETPPVDQIEKLSPAAYFSLFTEFTRLNPPHANDYPILDQMRRIGIEPGKSFAFDKASPEVQGALTEAGPIALKRIRARFLRAGVASAGWRINLAAIGTYGADYLSRAAIAYVGLGSNTVEDAVYPTALTDADGKPFISDNRYVLHFNKDQVPPVRGFWSLTMYNEKQLLAANPIDRYAIGDRDKLAFNPGRLARSLYPARGARPRQRVELAAGARKRPLHDESASLLAEAGGSRRKLGAARGEASAITSRGEVHSGSRTARFFRKHAQGPKVRCRDQVADAPNSRPMSQLARTLRFDRGAANGRNRRKGVLGGAVGEVRLVRQPQAIA